MGPEGYLSKVPIEYDNFTSPDEIRLMKFGGDPREDQFACSIGAQFTRLELHKGDLVMAKLEFGSHKNIDGIPYQEIRVTEIKKIG